MIPIFMAPQAIRIALVGRGERAAGRLEWLRAAGAAVDVWSDDPSEPLAQAAGSQLRHKLPGPSDLGAYHVIWLADLPYAVAKSVAAAARALNRLVNVEDTPDLCDFHSPALVRRGELTLAVSTGGASPAVARAARERLEQAFSPAWGEALESIARSREELRARGAPMTAVKADAHARLVKMGLIPS